MRFLFVWLMTAEQVHAAFAGCYEMTLESSFIPVTSFFFFCTKARCACSANTPLCASSVKDGWRGCSHRGLIRPIWSAGFFNELHRIRASFISCISRPSRQKESAGAPFLIVLLNYIAPDQLHCTHTAHLQLFKPILGHGSVREDCDFSMWS